MQKIGIVVIVSLLAVYVFFCTLAGAAECPEINATLRFELYKNYPQYEIAFFETFSELEQQKLTEQKRSSCPHLVELVPSVYVILLKKKQGNSYNVVQAEPHAGKSGAKWTVQTIGEFSDDTPVLDKAKSGFYSDIGSGKMLTVTRSSLAVRVRLLDSGKMYIYKSKGEKGFDSCQIK